MGIIGQEFRISKSRRAAILLTRDFNITVDEIWRDLVTLIHSLKEVGQLKNSTIGLFSSLDKEQIVIF